MAVETCGFCGLKLPTEQAVNRGWYPEWWYKHPETGEMVIHQSSCCVPCASKHLQEDDGQGDTVTLKDGETIPPEPESRYSPGETDLFNE